MTTRDQPYIAVEFMALCRRKWIQTEKSSNVIAFFFVMLIITNFTFRLVRKIAKSEY